MTKKELEFSTRLTREDVAGLIEALIEGLKDGRLKIQKSGESLELDVPRVIDLEIEASIDDERAEFEIEVSWRTNRAENPDDPPQNLPDAAKKTKAAKTAAPKKTTKASAKPAPAKTAAAARGAKKATAASAAKSAKAAPKTATKSDTPATKTGAKKSAAKGGKAKTQA